MTKDEVVRAFDMEINEAMKRGTTGDVTVSVSLNSGGIGKAKIETTRPLIPGARPDPDGRKFHGG